METVHVKNTGRCRELLVPGTQVFLEKSSNPARKDVYKRQVLNRNNYYGDLVQRKYESRFQRGEKWCDILDQSQWIITPNAHEDVYKRQGQRRRILPVAARWKYPEQRNWVL